MNNVLDKIKNLRERTGAGFLDCKKALEENKNDIEDSIDFLRKKGLAKASKKSSREAKEGAVGIYSNNDYTSIIQINTETDFAAKNEVFLNFMDEIGSFTLKTKEENLSVPAFNDMIFEGVSISDHFKNLISKIGENILLSKLIIVKNSNKQEISTYIHNAYRKNIGKIAVLMRAQVKEPNDDSKLLGKNLCMHIAASKPLAMNIDQLDKELIEKEKKIQAETIKASGKPENIIEKILEGKMKKFYSESTFMHQQYILDPDKTVNEVLDDFSKINEFKVLDYHSLVLGA